jgi:U4/U6 small nuclear ribonucleoprotein PRP3
MANKNPGPMDEFLTIRRQQGRHAFGAWIPPTLPQPPTFFYTLPTTDPPMSSIPAKRSAPVNENERAAELRRRAEAVRARMNADPQKVTIPTPASPQQNGSNMSPAEAGRARAAAVIAKLNASLGGAVSTTTSHALSPSSSTLPTSATEPKPTPIPTEIQSTVDSAKARIAAAMAKRQIGTTSALAPEMISTTPTPATQTMSKLEAMKARVAAASAQAQRAITPSSNAHTPARDVTPPVRSPATPGHVADTGRGGLGIGLHPTLAGEAGKGGLAIGLHPSLVGEDKVKGKQAQRDETGDKVYFDEHNNPYLLYYNPDTPPEGMARRRRGLNFTHTMHSRPAMEAANKIRQKAAVEAMKKDMEAKVDVAPAETEEEMLIKAYSVQEPAEVEFWDEDFVDTDPDTNALIMDQILIPIFIESPQSKLERKPLMLYLTEEETKKVRRIKRREVWQEEQAKIRLGLVPTPAPKLTHKNVMRVMSDVAIKNPTMVEQMVNEQVEERREKHETTNQERQLTKEQRLEKTKKQAESNAKKGLRMAVFRILLGTEGKKTLHNKHRYLLNMNAKQCHDVSGVCLVTEHFSALFVEAGEKSMRFYKNLVLKRIKWMKILAGGGDVPTTAAATQEEDNTCQLVWEGAIRQRNFKKWGGIRDTQSEDFAREALKKFKLEPFWVQIKAGVPDKKQEKDMEIVETPRLKIKLYEDEDNAVEVGAAVNGDVEECGQDVVMDGYEVEDEE